MLGLLYEKDSNKVTGVKIKRKEEEGQEEGESRRKTVKEDLYADFVVGAAGRKNHFKKWFQELGILNEGEEFPKVECFPGLGYSTSIWTPPEGEKQNKDRAIKQKQTLTQ